MPQLAAPKLFAKAAAAAAMLFCTPTTVQLHTNHSLAHTTCTYMHMAATAQLTKCAMMPVTATTNLLMSAKVRGCVHVGHTDLHVIAIGCIERSRSASASLCQLCSAHQLQQTEALSICYAKLLPVLTLQQHSRHKQVTWLG